MAIEGLSADFEPDAVRMVDNRYEAISGVECRGQGRWCRREASCRGQGEKPCGLKFVKERKSHPIKTYHGIWTPQLVLSFCLHDNAVAMTAWLPKAAARRLRFQGKPDKASDEQASRH